MSQVIALRGQSSPDTGKKYPLDLILKVFGISRSTFYDSLSNSAKPTSPNKRGPKTKFSDVQIIEFAREAINSSKFSGEGHRKVRAMLAKKDIVVGKTRLLRLLKLHGLLAPTRVRRNGKKRVHDGRIISDKPNEYWGCDMTEVMTEDDGKVYVFDLIDHCTAEIIGIHVSTNGSRFSAIECLHKATKKEFGDVRKDIARGTKIRLDHGTQFTSKRYVNESHHLGFELSYSYVAQPECNGIIERWHRTLKEQLIWTKSWKTCDEVKAAIEIFVVDYNEEWMLERHKYKSPLEMKAILKGTAA